MNVNNEIDILTVAVYLAETNITGISRHFLSEQAFPRPVSGSAVLFLTYYTQAMATAEELRSIASPLSP